jgi:UMF1 family MFS transporter
MGIGTAHLMGTVLMIQFIGGPATILFGKWSKKIGTRTAIEITLAGYIVICFIGYVMTEAWHFWLLGIIFACIQGPALSLSRAVFASMVPREKNSEFFGFFSLSERFAGIAGPLLFGVVGQFLGDSKYSILFLIVFFVFGWVILRRVKIDI